MEVKTNDAPPRREEASQLNSEGKDTVIERDLLSKTRSTESVSIPRPEKSESEKYSVDLKDKLVNTPCFPADVYENLPRLLQKGCEHFEGRERDVFLISALAVVSGCMENVSGTYDHHTIYPNVYTFTVAPAASGKGALSFARELAMAAHRKMLATNERNRDAYKAELEEYHAAKRIWKKSSTSSEPKMPKPPEFKILYIPGNSSAAAVIGHLQQSKGIGIICETEADTLTQSLKQDWGNYSDMLRKAFHHEPVTYSRKTNNEYLEVEKPRLSIALTGTPSQVPGLITSAEDGLFSRFIFYTFKASSKWRDVSPKTKVDLNEHFVELSEEVHRMIQFLGTCQTTFELTKLQWKDFNSLFNDWLNEVNAFKSEDASSIIIRLGPIAFRIAMVLSAIRKFEKGVTSINITCDDIDLLVVFELARVFKEHALAMFESLPKSPGFTLRKNNKKFYEALPNTKIFTRKEALLTGEELGIKERTVDGYLAILVANDFLEQATKPGDYRKKPKV